MINQLPASQAKAQYKRLCIWLTASLWLGVSGFASIQGSQAIAEEMTIPDATSAAPAPEPIAPAEPPLAAESAAPEFIPPEPQAVEPAPSEPVLEEPAPTFAAPPDYAPPVAVDPPSAPTQSDPYIDTRDYSVGATQPYTPPDQIVVNERSSGCQATLGSGQAIAASLCGPPPAQRLYTMPDSTSQAPAWASAPATAPAWADRGGESISAQTVQNTLQYSAVPPQALAVKPLTGANPLKWILNGERMIFPLPIPVDITSVFGWRVHPITGEWRFHSGTDLGAPMGTPVLAAYSGRVSLAEFLGGYGLAILLDHNKGQGETRYAHLSEIFVKPGQWVQQGTVIGLVGSTGNSTGPHLHFETLQATPDGLVAVDAGLELQLTMVQLAQALQTAQLATTSAQTASTQSTSTQATPAQRQPG